MAKTANVPAKYAYAWLTDFQPNDGRFSRSRPRFRVVRISPEQIVRIRTGTRADGSTAIAIERIHLEPPLAWHLDQIDMEDIEAVDYRITSAGPNKCRIRMDLTERWMVPKYPAVAQVQKNASAAWDRFIAALESDYKAGKPAAGK